MPRDVRRLRRLIRLPRDRREAAVVAVFAGGVAIRAVFMVLYRPAFLGSSDTGSYVNAAAHNLFSNVYDPAGYPLFIRLLHAIYPHLSLLTLVQHGLGIATAALVYLGVRRVTGSTAFALIPAVVVLFDGYGLWVEHTPITEALFTFLVVAALVLALYAAERPSWLLAGEGIVIAAAGLVRPVGLILIPIVGIWILWVRSGPALGRLVAAGAVIVPACAIVVGYLLVQRADTGFFGMTLDSGRVVYARAAMFADCSKFTPPPGTRALCETTPPSRRGSFNQYLTGFPDHASGVTAAGRSISPAWRVFGPPPAGNRKLEQFGLDAIINQPLDYISHVADDFHYYWADHHRAFIAAMARPNPGIERIVAGYYATGAGVSSGGLGFLRWYGEWIEVTGPLTIALLLLPLTGLLAIDKRTRRAAALFACAGWLLPLVADAVASVDPRFILPAYGPLAAAGAIGLKDGGWLRRVQAGFTARTAQARG
jgi:hypothetical protein